MPRKRRDYSRVALYLAANDRLARCFVCGTAYLSRFPRTLDYAHVLGRAYDDRGGKVHPLDVILLCGPVPSGCHGAYDRHELDITPFLTQAHIDRAKARAGEREARLRLRGSRESADLP